MLFFYKTFKPMWDTRHKMWSPLLYTHTYINPQNTFSDVLTLRVADSLIKSVNSSITGQPPGCQPGCGELSFGGLQLSLSVLTCLVLVPVQNAALQIAQIGLLKDTRSSVCTIFDALASERLFVSGRSHFNVTSGFEEISTIQKFLVKKKFQLRTPVNTRASVSQPGCFGLTLLCVWPPAYGNFCARRVSAYIF